MQIIMDWIALGFIAHLTGGIQSPILFFFIFHILIASILLSRRDCYFQATLAMCFVTTIALLEYFKIIPHISITNIVNEQYSDPASILSILFLFGSTLYISAFIATSIATALRSKERTLVLLQADIQEAYNDLEEASEAKNRFIVTVTHELRAPLAAVQSMLKVITEGYTGDISPKAKELMARAENRIIFLLELVSDLLDLARNQLNLVEIERTDVNLNEVIAELIDGIQDRAAAKRVELTTNIPSENIIIEGDRKEFEKLFGNLLSNAVKYTPEGGQASLTAELNGDKVNCVVADTGIGIPEESIEKLFDEFFRAGNAKDVAEYGTGIGLAIVKRIVDEYNGEISVESELGHGTKFSVSLPLHTQKADASPKLDAQLN
jgi:signal transduction histidine kinase